MFDDYSWYSEEEPQWLLRNTTVCADWLLLPSWGILLVPTLLTITFVTGIIGILQSWHAGQPIWTVIFAVLLLPLLVASYLLYGVIISFLKGLRFPRLAAPSADWNLSGKSWVILTIVTLVAIVLIATCGLYG